MRTNCSISSPQGQGKIVDVFMTAEGIDVIEGMLVKYLLTEP